MVPGKKTERAMKAIEELASTVADMPPGEAKKIIEDIEGDEDEDE